MKTVNVLFSFVFCLMLSITIYAQDENKLEYNYIQEMGTALESLSEAQQLEVLGHALQTSGIDIKKELSNILKELTKEEQNQVLSFAKKQNSMDEVRSVYPSAVPEPAYNGPITTITFDEEVFDFGSVDQGDKVKHVYKFTNTGAEPLIIANAKGSCGCTVPTWPKAPIAPGESAEIEVQFDSKGKKGKQNKRITITANTDPNRMYLTIKGEVLVPETEE